MSGGGRGEERCAETRGHARGRPYKKAFHHVKSDNDFTSGSERRARDNADLNKCRKWGEASYAGFAYHEAASLLLRGLRRARGLKKFANVHTRVLIYLQKPDVFPARSRHENTGSSTKFSRR